MAAGYRSAFYRWVGGISNPSTGPLPPEPVLCTCPTYTHDATLTNQFTKEQTLTSQFTNEQTLTNQWGRRNCNG